MLQFTTPTFEQCDYYAHFCSCYTADLFETTSSERLTTFIACAIHTSKLHPGYALWALLILTRYRSCSIAQKKKSIKEQKLPEHLPQHGRGPASPKTTTISETEQLFLAAYFLAAKHDHASSAVLPFWHSLAALIGTGYVRLRGTVCTIEKVVQGETSAGPNELCNMRILVEDAYQFSTPKTESAMSWWPQAEELQLDLRSVTWEEPQLKNRAQVAWFRRWRKKIARFLRNCYVSIYLP